MRVVDLAQFGDIADGVVAEIVGGYDVEGLEMEGWHTDQGGAFHACCDFGYDGGGGGGRVGCAGDVGAGHPVGELAACLPLEGGVDLLGGGPGADHLGVGDVGQAAVRLVLGEEGWVFAGALAEGVVSGWRRLKG